MKGTRHSEEQIIAILKQGEEGMTTANIFEWPILVFCVSLLAMFVAAEAGAFFRIRMHPVDGERQDYDIVLTATLTLLGLVIGFSFSMVINRYDQRKNYEEEEANAIGTEYLRVGLLPTGDTKKARELLRRYLDQRVLFYETHGLRELHEIDAQTASLQTQLWNLVESRATDRPTPPVALVVSGMNEVLNSQGYTQAAWWNRLPIAAWGLLIAIAVFSNILIGYGARNRSVILFVILPLAVSISFLLIADIDSPRHGLIRVFPQNLVNLAQSIDRSS